MALGFNNAPVNWDNSRIILSDRSGENYAAAIQQAAGAVVQGINQYAAKEQEKQRENDALEVLKLYGPQLGLDTSNEKALRAGVKSVGAGTLLKLADEGKQRQAEDATAIEVSKALGLYRPGMSATDAKALVGGEQTRAKIAYQDAMTGQMQASAGATQAQARQQEVDANLVKQILGEGGQLTPDAVLARGGSMELAKTARELLGKEDFNPKEVTLPSGTRLVQTSRNSFVPDPIQAAGVRGAGASTAPATETIGGKTYTKWGNRYFDAQGNPVVFGPSTQDPLGAAQANASRAEIAQLQGQIAEDQTALAQGDTRYALNLRSRQARIEENQRALAAAQARSGAAPVQPSVARPAAQPASGFASPEAVRAAMRSGTLTREQALQILQKDFGLQ